MRTQARLLQLPRRDAVRPLLWRRRQRLQRQLRRREGADVRVVRGGVERERTRQKAQRMRAVDNVRERAVARGGAPQRLRVQRARARTDARERRQRS
jgi:hypothetical protein